MEENRSMRHGERGNKGKEKDLGLAPFHPNERATHSLLTALTLLEDNEDNAG